MTREEWQEVYDDYKREKAEDEWKQSEKHQMYDTYYGDKPSSSNSSEPNAEVLTIIAIITIIALPIIIALISDFIKKKRH